MIITREQCFTRELCQIRKEAALSELRHVLLFLYTKNRCQSTDTYFRYSCYLAAKYIWLMYSQFRIFQNASMYSGRRLLYFR